MFSYSFQSFLSTYDNMPLIGDELQQEQNFSVSGPQVNHVSPQGPFQGPQTMQPRAQPPPIYNPSNNFNQSQGYNSQPPMYNINNLNSSQNFAQQQVGFNANQTYQQSQGFSNQTQQVCAFYLGCGYTMPDLSSVALFPENNLQVTKFQFISLGTRIS